jgi:small subunit ribosomal protein S13
MRIAGITIPDTKRLEVALTAIYGIGRTRSRIILDTAKIAYDMKAKDLSETQEQAIRKAMEGYTTEGELKREISSNIKRLKDVVAYRGMRHSRRLPVRGQRTKTNSRTVRGNVRKTMSSGRKTVEKK